MLLTSARGFARFYTDFLWFDELGIAQVWRGVLGAKVFLSLGFTALFFVLLLVNLVVADRLAPTFRPVGPEDEIVARYQEVVGPHSGKVRLGVALLFALITGSGAGTEWKSWLLFRNSVPFKVDDPLYGRDISFYVFRLPFLSYVIDWLFVAFVLVLLLTAVAHYLNGGIRLQSALQRVTPQVKAHVSVLLGMIALTKAAGYYLQRFELNFSTSGFVHGAGYTDVNARQKALGLLTLIMIAAFVLVIANIWRRGWALPGVATVAWAVSAFAAGILYPTYVQNVTVNPAENARERPYIVRNIEATRAAYGIEGVKETPYQYTESLTAGDLEKNAASVRNIRLWDPSRLVATYQGLQELRSFYRFSDVDIDRYVVDDQVRSVVLAVRGLDTEGIPGRKAWVNTHLQYTHGYGAVLSSANAVDSDGRPDFLVSNIPPQGEPALSEDGARVYFSESLDGYAIVNTKQREIDYQTSGEPETTSYTGDAGVQLSSSARRMAFALRFWDANTLLSSQLTRQSRVIFKRDIHERVRAAAPFLSFDSDPYPVVVEGRIFYVQDAYTTTSRYPYSQRVDSSGLRLGSDLRDGGFNYARNSVKVVIDAFNGTTTFYVWDDEDPLVQAYQHAFPALFTSRERMPAEMRAHMRYPEDLFRVQANMYAKYHVTNPNTFFASNDDWNIAQDPGTGRVSDRLRTGDSGTGSGGTDAGSGSGSPATSSLVAGAGRVERIEPTYVLLQLPGDAEPSFVILQPFVPGSRDDRQRILTAFLTARSDVDDYGRLEAFVMPRDQQIDGPLLVDNAVQSEPDISRELTVLNQQGSAALLGQVQLIPMENSLLYVRPLYVSSERTNMPEVKRVIVVHAGKAVMRPTLREALAELFGAAPATLEEGTGGGGGGSDSGEGSTPSDATVDALLSQAEAAFSAADQALTSGDLALYQKKTKEARALVAEAARRLSAGSSTSSTTTPSTTTSQPSA